MIGSITPPVPNPELWFCASMPSPAVTSARGTSPSVAIPSMSDRLSPASAMASRAASSVNSRPGIPVFRPIRDIPRPLMIASFSKLATDTVRSASLLF